MDIIAYKAGVEQQRSNSNNGHTGATTNIITTSTGVLLGVGNVCEEKATFRSHVAEVGIIDAARATVVGKVKDRVKILESKKVIWGRFQEWKG